MLKNWFSSARIRNFIKSGFFADFFIKKLIQMSVKFLNIFTVFFLEKFFIEFIPKKIQITIKKLIQYDMSIKAAYIVFVMMFINIALLLLAVFIL